MSLLTIVFPGPGVSPEYVSSNTYSSLNPGLGILTSLGFNFFPIYKTMTRISPFTGLYEELVID